MKKAIYKITNLLNDKCYIGQSVNPQRRYISHISRAMNDTDNSPIHSAIKKYGKDNFKLEVIEWTENYNDKEKYYIKYYNSMSPNGYNVAPGGEEPPHRYGEQHHKSIVTDKQVAIIKKELKEGNLTEPKIGMLFDPPVNQVLINNINWGITHRSENETYPIRSIHPYYLTEKEIEEIKWLLTETNYPFWQIAEHYVMNVSTIKAINTGRTHHSEGYSYPIRKHRGEKQSEPVETILAKRSTDAIDTHLEMGVCAKSV